MVGFVKFVVPAVGDLELAVAGGVARVLLATLRRTLFYPHSQSLGVKL